MKDIMKSQNVILYYNICPKQIILCQYNNIGCNVEMKREMKKHLEMSVKMIKDLQAKSVVNQVLLSQLQAKLDQFIEVLPSPFNIEVIKFTNFTMRKDEDNDWYSPGFYTSSGGYKMSLNVCPNGHDEGKGTHVSCYVCLMSGEYDDILEWPFQGVVTVELLNQLEDKDHHIKTTIFNETTPPDNRQIVIGKQYGRGWGYPQFIAHSELSLNSFLNHQYLKDDTLYFRVSVTVTSKTKPWLTNTI